MHERMGEALAIQFRYATHILFCAGLVDRYCCGGRDHLGVEPLAAAAPPTGPLFYIFAICSSLLHLFKHPALSCGFGGAALLRRT